MTSIITEQSFSNSFDQYYSHEYDFYNFHSLIKKLGKKILKPLQFYVILASFFLQRFEFLSFIFALWQNTTVTLEIKFLLGDQLLLVDGCHHVSANNILFSRTANLKQMCCVDIVMMKEGKGLPKS